MSSPPKVPSQGNPGGWWGYAKKIGKWPLQDSTPVKKLGVRLGQAILLPLVVGVGATVEGIFEVAKNAIPTTVFVGSVILGIGFGVFHLARGWLDPHADLTRTAASYFFKKASSRADKTKNFLRGLGKVALGSIVAGSLFGILPLVAAAAGPLWVGVIAKTTLKKWWGRSKQDVQTQNKFEDKDQVRTRQANKSTTATHSQNSQPQQVISVLQAQQDSAHQITNNSRGAPPVLFQQPSHTNRDKTLVASNVLKYLKTEDIEHIKKQKDNINEKIKAYNTIFKLEKDNIPKFTGRDPVSALQDCGNVALQGLYYTLNLPEGTLQQANMLLANAKKLKISKVFINQQEYAVEQTTSGYQVRSAKDASPPLSQYSSNPTEPLRTNPEHRNSMP